MIGGVLQTGKGGKQKVTRSLSPIDGGKSARRGTSLISLDLSR